MILLKGIHLLFTGSNDSKTYGVTVQSQHTKEYCREHGLQHHWDLNTCSLNDQTDEVLIDLGITPEDIIFIRDRELGKIE